MPVPPTLRPLVAPAFRDLVAVGAAVVATGAATAYVRAVDPSSGGWFPGCAMRAITGLWCPGCGLTRATHHLLHGDLVTAIRYNVLVVPVLAAVAAVLVGWSLRRLAPGRPPIRTGWAVAAIVPLVAFAVVRNLPGLEILRGGAAG